MILGRDTSRSAAVKAREPTEASTSRLLFAVAAPNPGDSHFRWPSWLAPLVPHRKERPESSDRMPNTVRQVRRSP